MKIIAFAGKAGSGKSTACGELVTNYDAIELNFAYPLKVGVSVMFGWSDDECWDEKLKNEIDPSLGFSPRKALQAIGTDAVRNLLGKDVWVHMMRKALLRWKFGINLIVIGDMRFDNECSLVREFGGTVCHIIRPTDKSIVDTHASESGITLHSEDKTVYNNENFTEFLVKVNKVAAEVLTTQVDS